MSESSGKAGVNAKIVEGWIFTIPHERLQNLVLGGEFIWGANQDIAQMRPGQTTYIWVDGELPGFIAIGTITSNAVGVSAETLKDGRYQTVKVQEGDTVVYVEIQKKLRRKVSREEILQEPSLNHLRVLHQPNGTNYPLTVEEERKLGIYLKTKELEPLGQAYTGTNEKMKRSDTYIDPAVLGHMIDALSIKKNVIIEGAPGVGKTKIADFLAETFASENSRKYVWPVHFHQAITYEDFIQGWKPLKTGGFQLSRGLFLRFCSAATKEPDKRFVMVIEEINRGNVNKIFGELFTLIEHDKRGTLHSVILGSSEEGGEEFFVPENVYLIGTMNSADHSTEPLDQALRRRFRFFTIHPAFSQPWFVERLQKNGVPGEMATKICEVMGELNERLGERTGRLGQNVEIGHSYFLTPILSNQRPQDWLRDIVDSELAPTLTEGTTGPIGKVNECLQRLRG